MLSNTIIHLLLYIFLASMEISSKSIISIFEPNIFEEEMWMLAHQIIKEYFEDEYLCLTYISSDLDTAWPLRSRIPVLSIDMTDDYSQDDIILRSYNDGCGGYVIRSKPERKEEIIKSLYFAFSNATNFRYNTQRYLFLPFDENDQDLSVLSIKEMFWFPELIMVTLNSPHPYNFSLISHTYFNGYKFDVLGMKYEAIEFWTAKKGFEHKIDIYYDRTLNVHGKQLNFGLINYSPYALILKDGNNRTYYDGLEVRIAAMYVDIINGTWDAIDHPVYFWGDVYEDGTADGIFGSALYHRADLGFSGLYRSLCNAVACSYPYVFSEATCMVPRPHRKSGWLTVVLPFTPNTWLGLIITYIISSTFVFLMMSIKAQMKEEVGKKEQSLTGIVFFDAFYNTFRLQVEQIPKIAARKDSIGVFFKFCNIYYFFVASCWIGGVASLLTLPKLEDPIATTEDLVARQDTIEWGANAIGWIAPIRESTDPYLKVINDKFVVLDDDTLSRRTKTGDFAFFMERLPHGHYGMSDYIDEESIKYLQIMAGTLFTSYVIMVQPRGSPWQRGLDKLIFRLLDAGILQKLEVQVSLDVANNKLQEMIRTSNAKPVEELSPLLIRHLEAPIFIYIGGVSFSIITFMLELSCFKLMKILSTTKFRYRCKEIKKRLGRPVLSTLLRDRRNEAIDGDFGTRDGVHCRVEMATVWQRQDQVDDREITSIETAAIRE